MVGYYFRTCRMAPPANYLILENEKKEALRIEGQTLWTRVQRELKTTFGAICSELVSPYFPVAFMRRHDKFLSHEF